MIGRATPATAGRVLAQLRHDPRTIALLILVPVLLITLLKLIFDGREEVFQQVGGPLLGIFPLITMFLITSITMLRERTSGTLERLMTMPLSKLDLLAGYGIAFAVVAAVQGVVVCSVAFGLLGLDTAGPVLGVIGLAVANAVLGMALGLFVSAFASSEFQAVQFMPAFILPQLLLCGLFVERDAMAPVLEAVAAVLPMTFAFDALDRLTTEGSLGGAGWLDVAAVAGYTLLALALGAVTLRRRTA